MYLIKLSLDPNHPSVRQSLRDRNDLHRNLMKAFHSPRADVCVLYRLIEKKDRLEVLLLTQEQPVAANWQNNGIFVISTVDLGELPALYREGAILHFNLLASPSKKVKEEGRENSRRVFLRKAEDRQLWLQHQAEKYGFSVLSCSEPAEPGNIRVGRSSGAFMLSTVEFDGMLQITDADLFWDSWKKGIGAEKAYGLGLLLLSK